MAGQASECVQAGEGKTKTILHLVTFPGTCFDFRSQFLERAALYATFTAVPTMC